MRQICLLMMSRFEMTPLTKSLWSIIKSSFKIIVITLAMILSSLNCMLLMVLKNHPSTAIYVIISKKLAWTLSLASWEMVYLECHSTLVCVHPCSIFM